MKKLITLIALVAIAGVASAGLVDAGMDGSVVVQTVANYQTPADAAGWVGQESDWVMAGGILSFDTTQAANNTGFGQIMDGASFTDGMTFTYDMAYNNDFFKYNIRVLGVNDVDANFTDNLTALNAPSILGADNFTILYGSGTISVGAGSQGMTDMGDFNVDAAGYDYIVVTMVTRGSDTTGAETLAFDNVNVIPEPATLGLFGFGAFFAMAIRRIRM